MKATNSLIFVGGFGSTLKSMEHSSNELSKYFEDVSPVTFRQAMEDEEFSSKIENHPVLTHSAGIVAVGQGWFESLTAVAPPIPTKSLKLVTASCVKSYHIMFRNRQDGDKNSVKQFINQTTKEIAGHPVVHAKLLGKVVIFDAFTNGIELAKAGVRTQLTWMTDDDYFNPIFTDDFEDAIFSTVPNFRMNTLPGEHDELLVRPQNLLNRIFS